MKGEAVVQDCLFSSAMVLKTIAMLITVYALDRYAGLAFETNPVTRFLLQNQSLYLSIQLAVFVFICLGYSRVRSKFLAAYKMWAIRWSFNALVGFLFIAYLWDAANDLLVLLGVSLIRAHG